MREAVLTWLQGRGGFRSAGEVARELKLPRARVKTVLELLEMEGAVSSRVMEFERNGATRTGKGYQAGGKAVGLCHFVVALENKKNPYRQCLAPAVEHQLCAEHLAAVERTIAGGEAS